MHVNTGTAGGDLAHKLRRAAHVVVLIDSRGPAGQSRDQQHGVGLRLVMVIQANCHIVTDAQAGGPADVMAEPADQVGMRLGVSDGHSLGM